ncbi:MAG: DMT family transporter [Gammaproteobacteria bacterium]|nr:DMT family transporter [Gammaproteobacteria bacterium]
MSLVLRSISLSRSTQAWLWFLGSLLISTTNDVIVKHIGLRLSGIEVSFFRFFFAAVILLVTCYKPLQATARVHHRTHILRSLFLGAGMSIWTMALPHVHLVQATMINLTIPLMNLVLARSLLGESISTRQYIATFLGFAGVLLTLHGNVWAHGSLHMAELSLLVGAWFFAYVDLLNKISGGEEAFVSTLFWTAVYTSIFCAIGTFYAFTMPSLYELSLLAALGCNANALFYCLLRALSILKLSDLAPMKYVEVLLALMGGWIFFSEQPSLHTCLGGVLIMIAAIQAVRNEKNKREA